MEIFIIRDGKQTGPYTEDAVQSLLDKGSVRSKDMGWRKGLAAWLPLSEVLKPNFERANLPPQAPGPTERAGTNGASRTGTLATAKQKALLKYLGVEFSDGVSKEEAAVVISDALEAPKFQGRIVKWHGEKLRLHPNVFQDEIDFQKANRNVRYLEQCQTEGAEMVKDVTKAHVQVLLESLDKRFPNWESEPKAALWDYLLPSIAEHFPKLVLPAAKGRLRLGGVPKMAAAPARKPNIGSLPLPPAPPGAFGAAMRGLIYGAIALGVIFVADHFFGADRFLKSLQSGGGEPTAQPVQPPEPAKAAPPTQPAEAPVVVAKPPENAVGALPEIPPVNPAPAPVAPAEPAVVPPAPVPTPPGPPAMAENKPPMAGEKPAIPPAPVPPVTPAPVEPPAPAPVAPVPVAPAAPRTSVTLIQGISVALQNGQVTLPAGTQLKYLALEGQNVRVSWNNNVFYVPMIATDISREPSPPPAAPAANPPAQPAPPGLPPVPGAPRKPGDDL